MSSILPSMRRTLSRSLGRRPKMYDSFEDIKHMTPGEIINLDEDTVSSTINSRRNASLTEQQRTALVDVLTRKMVKKQSPSKYNRNAMIAQSLKNAKAVEDLILLTQLDVLGDKVKSLPDASIISLESRLKSLKTGGSKTKKGRRTNKHTRKSRKSRKSRN